jgi:hypothetical protein
MRPIFLFSVVTVVLAVSLASCTLLTEVDRSAIGQGGAGAAPPAGTGGLAAGGLGGLGGSSS